MIDVCGVYGIFAVDTGECLYVGESTRINHRWTEHLKALKNGSHSRQDFVAWFIEQNSDSSKLEFRLLKECDPSDLGEVERFYFDLLSPKFFGLIPHGNRQWFQTEDTRKKISQALKVRYTEPNAKSVWQSTVDVHGYEKAVNLTSPGRFNGNRDRAVRAGQSNKGKTKSKEHKENLSKSLRSQTLVSLDAEIIELTILKSPTNISMLADEFGVSRPTMRKYLKRFDLIALLEANRLSEYVSIICENCSQGISKNRFSAHIRKCNSPLES